MSQDNQTQVRVVNGSWAVEVKHPNEDWKQVEQGQSYEDAVNLVEVVRLVAKLAECRVELTEDQVTEMVKENT